MKRALLVGALGLAITATPVGATEAGVSSPTRFQTPTSQVVNPVAVNDAVLWKSTELYKATILWNKVQYANTHKIKHSSYGGEALYGNGACGGNLPTCRIMQCENGGKITGRNPTNHRVSGKWQIDDGTWDGYGGYSSAEDAPESVQDERAAQIWDGGNGRGQWAC